MAQSELDFFGTSGISLPEMVSIGRSIFDPVWAEEEHTDGACELIHFPNGSGEIQTAEYTIHAREGDTVFLPSLTPHRDLFAKNSALEVYLIQFRWDQEPDLLKALHPSQMTNISQEAKHRIGQEVHSLLSDFAKPLPMGRELTSINTLRIIMLMCREAAATKGMDGYVTEDLGRARRLQIMMQIKRIIGQSFNKPISLADIADKLNISPYYVSRVFSEESGFRMSSYITQIRMEKAVELLDDPLLNISEVARAVGFSDSHYFGQVFKSHFGVSPKAYRAKLLVDEAGM